MRKIEMIAIAASLVMATTAWGAKTTPAAKAEKAMTSACEKEFASDVKGKKAQEIAEWVEQEEHGTNADKFKKSKCYAAHEKWESAAGKNEAGEEHEHK